MQVILQEDVAKLGKAGEVVNVRDGFGRNFLLPQKMAVLADLRNLKQLDHHKRAIASRQQKARKAASEVADELGKLSITIAREVGEEDRLFGSVTNKDIADALRSAGHIVDRHAIGLAAPIKDLGIFDVPVKLHPEVTATVKIWVVKK